MKKVILPAVLIAASMIAFSFKGVNKQAVNHKVASEQEVLDAAAYGCFRFNETIKDFTKCYEISDVEQPLLAGQVADGNKLLDQY